MNASKKESTKLLINRIHRLIGQLEAVERMIESEQDPKAVLVQLQACISAIGSVRNNYSKHIILSSSLSDIREVVDLLTQ